MTSHTPVALQLYTVREPAAADFAGTLAHVAAAGYDGVELAGLHSFEAEWVRDRCDSVGLTVVGAHVSLSRFEAEAEAVASELGRIGTRLLVFPSVPAARSAADIARTAERLARAVAVALALSLRPVFHNHSAEFERIDGVRLWDAIAGVEGLELELDLGWAWVAGEDPEALIGACEGRVPIVHVKDHVRRGDATPDVPVGDGEIPYDRVLPVARAAGVEWLVVEQDEPGADPFGAAARSLGAVRKLAAT